MRETPGKEKLEGISNRRRSKLSIGMQQRIGAFTSNSADFICERPVWICSKIELEALVFEAHVPSPIGFARAFARLFQDVEPLKLYLPSHVISMG